MTGVTSNIGRIVLTDLMADPHITHVTALTRSPFVPQVESSGSLGQLKFVQADLLQPDLEEILAPEGPFDFCLHLAALTHSHDSSAYFAINFHATIRLAQVLQKMNCFNFGFMSSQTAGENAGAYARSKLHAEQELLKMSWKHLFIWRPSEVVGAGSKEGLDLFFYLAQNLKIYPLLIRSVLPGRKIVYSPLSANALSAHLMKSIRALDDLPPVVLQSVHGPEISAMELGVRLFKEQRAIPIPVYLPLLQLILGVFNLFGKHLMPPDQLPRLLGLRSQKPNPTIVIEDCQIGSPTYTSQSS